MIPISEVKRLDLHRNDRGELCIVNFDGSLVPYSPAPAVAPPASVLPSDPPVAFTSAEIETFISEVTPPSAVAPVAEDSPASPAAITREEIEAMDWRSCRKLCEQYHFDYKPDNQSWQDYLLEKLAL